MNANAFRLKAVLFDIGVLRDAAAAHPLLQRLSGLDLALGLISTQMAPSLKAALQGFAGIDAGLFSLLICPATAAAVADAAMVGNGIEHLGIDDREAVTVSADPAILATAAQAGTMTLAVKSGQMQKDGPSANFAVSDLSEIFDLLRPGLPLRGGKFPNELLERHFKDFSFDDPSLIVQPAVGEDTAAVDIADEEVLVLKSDPITFAADAIGHYAVLVNANDIATAGANPRWMLTTLLFPPGTTPSEVIQVMDELQRVSRQWGITLCGGHTEISDAVTRPVVVGVMAGTVTRAGLVDKRDMRPGDRVFLTKAVSVEGTSIIAREFGPKMQKLGVSEDEIRRCRRFLKDISILAEAALAAGCSGVTAMHDVTEGGLSTALLELAWAGGHHIRVDMDRIPVFDETRRLCNLLGIDPLGLIGSGSLLICCRPEEADQLSADVRKAGIRITHIGEVMAGNSGVTAQQKGKPTPWPRFEVDEIARLF